MRRIRWWALPVVAVATALPVIGPASTSPRPTAPAPTSPAQAAAGQTSCVACHTSRTALEVLVRPLPAPPAEGEG